ncbi:MAG: pantoate--beta-alanine ligase [Gammaproteobacteria bacterium]|nr:MAG: pantoate--beta-alanine ligase [Gammaproteobacteria bacterium]
MHTISHVRELRGTVAQWRAEGERIALVPTMGNLHDGHMALVERARQLAGKVVVSIFVNPTQFVAGEDFDRYPRTPREDAVRLTDAGVDILFLPTTATLYPHGLEGAVTVQVPSLDGMLCGASRPGHFTGVATVVTKLFNLVQPDMAVFGEKDYQQLLVIRRLTEELCLPVEIIGVPTVREADGLALSSRNAYLDEEQRARAPHLYRVLREAAARLEAGDPPAAVCQGAIRDLEDAGFLPDYFEVRRATDLGPAGPEDRALRILAAARLGETRLIDNIAAHKGVPATG